MRLSLCLSFLSIFWAALYLPALGVHELQGEEARRVLPGRTMIQTGEWLVPRSGGEVYNRKPPLINWVSAAAIKLTGRMDEWTVRMPSVLMMLALGLSILLCLRVWLGNDQALLTALITLTSIDLLFDKGRLVEIEALYISLFGIALVLWLGLRWQGRDLAAWLASGAVLGLGFLAKGPPHMWYFYALVVGVLLAEKRGRDLLSWKHLCGLAVFFAVWTPWAIMNSARNPLNDSTAVWQDQITQRLGFAEFNLKNYLLQVPQSLVNFLPWTLLLPLCWHRNVVAIWRNKGRHGQWMLGLRKGLLWAFFVIALLPSSRPRFMLPVIIAAAVLVADALACMGAGWLARWGRCWRWGMAAIASIGLGVLAVGSIPFITPLSEHQFEATGWVLWVMAACMIVSWLWRKPAPDTLPTFGISTAFAFTVLIGVFTFAVLPRLITRDKLRPFAARIVAQTGPTEPILLYKVAERMWPFYLGLRCFELADPKDLATSRPFRWVIVPRNLWNSDPDGAIIKARFGSVVSESPLSDPLDHTNYVLLGFAGR